VIPHQGVLHLVDWAAYDLGVGPGDRLTNVNPIYFDNSVFDIYAGLLNGAATVALDDEITIMPWHQFPAWCGRLRRPHQHVQGSSLPASEKLYKR
jgi:non-ribosomal peptide synthetase component F